MQPTFCFIDDADFELDNFQKNVAPAFKGVEFVYARDFDRALHKLAGRRCLCFLLDIYGAAPGAGPGDLPDAESLAPALGQGFEVGSLYQDLQGESGEKANQFLRRLYGRVQVAQEAFTAATGQLGQGAAFGLHSLAQVREHQPWATALGYSRKALYADAAAMCLGGADGVLQKPQGADEAAIAKASHQAAPELAEAAFAAVDHRLSGMAGLAGLRLCQSGVSLPLVEALQEAVGQINGREKRSAEGRYNALEKLKAVRLEDLELEQRDTEVILALWDWLSLET
ncbi:MAG: hypothetical protein KQI62_08755 [Deltaproteobacteria bacterium]|nr:hypothetical protein [Deltaproteobacteria bacterium]